MNEMLGQLITVTAPVVCTVLGGAAVNLRRMGRLEQLAQDHADELRDVTRRVDAHVGNYGVHRMVTR